MREAICLIFLSLKLHLLEHWSHLLTLINWDYSFALIYANIVLVRWCTRTWYACLVTHGLRHIFYTVGWHGCSEANGGPWSEGARDTNGIVSNLESILKLYMLCLFAQQRSWNNNSLTKTSVSLWHLTSENHL